MTISSRKRIATFILGLMLAAQAFALYPAEKAEPTSFVQKIADMNMRSFGWEDDDWDAHTMREFLTEHMKRRLQPTAKQKRHKAYEFYKTLDRNRAGQSSVLFDAETTWGDTTLFCGQGDRELYVAETLARTQTELGKVSLFTMLAEPIRDVERLAKRQEIIKTILSDDQLIEHFDALFKAMEIPENVFLSFYKQDHLVHTVKHHGKFNINALDGLNKSEFMLLLRNIYGHQERIGWAAGNAFAAFVLTTYGILNLTNVIDMPEQIKKWSDKYSGSPGPIFPWLLMINNRWFHSLIAIGGGVLCGLQVKNSIEWVGECMFLEECVHTITIQLAQFINAARVLHDNLQKHPQLAGFDEFDGLITFFEKTIHESENLQELLGMLATKTFEGECSVLSHKGRIVRVYTLMHEIKKELEELAHGIGKLDAYFSLAKLFKEFQAKRVGFCMPTYLQAETPQLQITNFWHPLIDENVVIENSVTLGTDGQRPNMIITGPNAGGKSTVLKAIVLCVMLAQTVGLAPAQSMSLTPFNSISTYLNIVDDIAAGNSLFMAEAKQAQRLIDKVEKSGPGEFNLTVFDEVFNGTAPLEGSAAAYSVAHHLGKFHNTMCLISTHFSLLTNLEHDTSAFQNYKVSVHQTRDGGIAYPYLLEQGISHQNVALDILRAEGFDGSLLNKAQDIVAQHR